MYAKNCVIIKEFLHSKVNDFGEHKGRFNMNIKSILLLSYKNINVHASLR